MEFDRRTRLVVLVVLGVVPPSFAILLLKYTISATTPAGIQAAVAGGIITAIGTVSSAIYKEVSSYFQQTDSNVDKKVTMISPLVQNYYSPWINSAQILHSTLERLAGNDSPTKEDVQTLLYDITVYYGYRMKFIVEAGGLILLSSTEQQRTVLDAYRATETALDWEGPSTHGDVSYLQYLFLTKNSQPDGTDGAGSSKGADNPPPSTKTQADKGAPYLYHQFSGDISGDAYLPAMVDSLTAWAKTKNNLVEASARVGMFASTFQEAIDQLYTAWGE